MKRSVCLILSFFILLSAFCFSFADETADVAGLITITDGKQLNGEIKAGNNVTAVTKGDVFMFAFNGTSDPMIDIRMDAEVDTAEYPVVGIKARRSGTETDGEIFYNGLYGFADGEKSVRFSWNESTDWQWLRIDLSGCGGVGYMRFDVFDTALIDTVGMIAAVGFFRSEEALDSYAKTEEAGSFGTLTGDASVSETIAKEKEAAVALYDTDSQVNPGYWFSPYAEGQSLSFSLEFDKWFDRVWFAYYAAAYKFPVRFSISDGGGETVFTEDVYVLSNSDVTVDLGKRIKPGYYTIVFEAVEPPAGDLHFVIGSAAHREDGKYELEISSVGTNNVGGENNAPAIRLLTCDPDPEYTGKTEEPATEAPSVTAAPTDAPAGPTDVPQESAEAPSQTEKNDATAPSGTVAASAVPGAGGGKSNSNTGLIIGIAASCVVIIAAVVTIIIASVKKKK